MNLARAIPADREIVACKKQYSPQLRKKKMLFHNKLQLTVKKIAQG